MQSVTSRDGTRIAYDRWGTGPVVIVVNGALSDRSGNLKLAQLLTPELTVYSYDRRGRGDSTDTQPYSVKREIEDIEALILNALLAADRREDAITLFMKFVGAPDELIAKIKASPAWAGMLAMAPTLAYDNAVVGDDRSVPVEAAAKVKAMTLVMDGSASIELMPFMRATADKLAEVLPNAQRQVLDGQGHDVSEKVLAPILLKFFN